ncbi:MAG TPA: hypothetical protein VK400_19415, partial [Pyrinomonadaceae bacterium]|nr:hypothetical protein [Pyrinomonadaceae bacterium]
PQPKKFFEVGLTTNEHLDALLDTFIQGELEKKPAAKGYFVNYGEDRFAERNELRIKSLFKLRGFDISRITLVRGGFLKEVKTEAWLIPPGANPPELIQQPHKIDSFGRIAQSDFKKRFGKFLGRLREEASGTGYIFIDGSPNYAAGQERFIRNRMRLREFSSFRISIVRGDPNGKPRTQLWLIPAGLTADEIERDDE